MSTLQRSVIEADERVRLLPGDLVKAAQPAAQGRRDRVPLAPKRPKLAAPGDDHEVDVGALIGLVAGSEPFNSSARTRSSHPSGRGFDDSLVFAHERGHCSVSER